LSETSSSYRVQYDLRPAKQVERRMIIDALQRLSTAGFPITDYQYTGFGAIYFVDFIVDPDFDSSKKVLGPKEWKDYFEYHASSFLRLGLSEEDFGKSKLVLRSAEILRAAFTKSIVARPELEFLPMFHFVYKDSQ